MAIRFNSALLAQDLETARKRRRLSMHKAANRMNITQSTMSGLRNGKIKDITVTSLARIMDFMGITDIDKYIYEDGES